MRAVLLSLILLILGMSAPLAQGVVAPEILAQIRDDDSNPLPRGLTPAERAIYRIPDLSRMPAAPPPVPVRATAEYEFNDGLLVRWGTFNALLTEMIVAATTLDPTARMFVVVSGASQQSSATTTLQNAGANMSRVVFIQAPTNSVWMRDYGPRYVDQAGARAIVDHVYNRPRPQDDAIPGVIAQLWNEPKYDIPLTHGGGNFHLFGTRDAYMTELILNENPSLTQQQVLDYYQAYQGLNVTILPAFPTSFDSTQHIDMWMLPVDDDEVIISQYSAAAGTPATIANNAATLMQGRGYTVYRTPGWQSGSTHFTYANAVVLNNLVMVCRFNSVTTENETARAVFASAFQDKQIVQVDCSSIITSAGAIHCIVMHVPALIDTLFRNDFE